MVTAVLFPFIPLYYNKLQLKSKTISQNGTPPALGFPESRINESVLQPALTVTERYDPMANIMEFSGDNFETEVVNSDVPVLVDFWAPWCGPCKMITPIIEELSGEFGDKVKIGKINVDNNQDLAAKFGIRGIPTVMLFKGGEVFNSFVGVRPKEDLATAINSAL